MDENMGTSRKTHQGAEADSKKQKGISSEERSALKARLKEIKSGEVDGESEVVAAISEMVEPDRTTATRFHAIIKASVPALSPKTWYGMPAYARDGVVICHFQPAKKFKTRYPTIGFSDKAHLDEGSIWPVAYAILELTPDVEVMIAALVKKAAG